MNLPDLLRQNEGKTLEFKRDLSSPEKVLRTLVAFANTSGGRVVIGVEDATKHVRGLADPLAEEERLASLIADLIFPRLVPSIDIVAWRDTQVLVIEVFPSSSRPHHLRKLGPEEGTFVRLGSTNRRADLALRQELTRMAANETFDESPLPELDSEAIDFRVASELFPSRATLKSPDLQTLRLLAKHGRRLVPTVGGLLLAGRDPGARFPDAWIQCGRFRGEDKTHMDDTVECRGTLTHALEAAYQFIERHAPNRILIPGLKNQQAPGIPLRAARELLVNAVVHADYAQSGAPIRVALFSDRLEIENPGVLLAGLTLDDIRQGVSRLRNRIIGRVFKEIGYIEQWGSGIQRATAACAAAGLPPPILEEHGFRFRATLGLTPDRTATLDLVDTKIRDLLQAATADTGLSTAQLATAVGLTTRTLRSRLARLIDEGLVTVIGKNARDPHRKYHWNISA
ncbi:MAG: helix-turn-helix domain-containing protein [Opitutaceae bacterium]|jgi:predicted HTH transcriptional regulator